MNFKISVLPKTKLGRWSLGLAAAMPVLFLIGTSLTNSLYESVPAGSTILEDIVKYDWIRIQGLPALKERKYFHVLQVL